MANEEYIKERMKEFASNISDFSIGEIVLDKSGRKCKITDKTQNSIQVFMERTSTAGISCMQWFDMKRFNDKFKKSS